MKTNIAGAANHGNEAAGNEGFVYFLNHDLVNDLVKPERPAKEAI